MTVSHYRHRRTSTAATPFPSPVEPGEIVVNTANRQLAVGDAASGVLGQPLALLAVRVFDVRAQYGAGDYVVQAGTLYRAKIAIVPGAFNAANWDAITAADVNKAYVDAGDAAVTTAFQSADTTLQTNINAKADKTYVDAADALKADKTYVDAADALKADKTYVDSQDALKAPLASPTFTGDPKAPTPTVGDNDTSIATTAFVKAAVDAGVASVPAPPVAATAAEWISNSAPGKMLTPGAAWGAAQWKQCVDASGVFTPDMATGCDFYFYLNAAGMTLANPVNMKPGQKGLLFLLQNTSGTIGTWGTYWKFPGGIKPTLSTASGAADCISYFWSGALFYCTFTADFR